MEEDAEVDAQFALRRNTAFRFKGCTDVELLKEVNHVRPFEAPYGEVRKRWTEVSEHLQRIYGTGITVNATRKRFDDLMTAFQEETMAALRASGTEEEYEEREQLLQDNHDLVDTASVKKQACKDEKARQNERRESDGERIRDAAMTTIKRKLCEDDDSLEEPNRKQGRSSQRVPDTAAVVASLVEMVAKANEVKANEVRVQRDNNLLTQQKLELEEKRYELDKAEREARFSLERREREAQLEFMQGTLEVLKSFLNKM
ncbi:hypothetical protein H310_12832 [Aphanomyces invadans]|uniref:Uncharacterized protein n=1 Tax=Aphanomyces invadans TaxID=157072 RepID=A0A024TG74_9STRA|nr:hypothetical protein H310_12832 [Aphanomyces invadans]ETV92994.1 hypothetical protein H310_12832 [Aphanomyces invadans]|eukprot:XP_008878259.1 hypothetical protein H310_12832 [Aphanomyces invadans]